MCGVKIKIFHAGSAEILLLGSESFDIFRRQWIAPVKFALFAAPAHGCSSWGTDKIRAESLINRIINIDTIKFTVFCNIVLFPCFTPGTFRNISLKCRFGTECTKLHLSVIVRLPLAVSLVGHCVERIAVSNRSCSHSCTSFFTIDSHTV